MRRAYRALHRRQLVTLFDIRISEGMKSYLGNTEVPPYNQNTIDSKASSLPVDTGKKHRVALAVALLVLIPATVLAFAQPQVRHAFVSVFMPNAVNIRIRTLTFLPARCGKPICAREARAWLAHLPKTVPFKFIPPRGLPRDSAPCGYMFGSGLYGIDYCMPDKKGFMIFFIRYRPEEYRPGAVSSIRLSELSMSWSGRLTRPYLFVTGNELVIVNPTKYPLTSAQVNNIRRAMHGVALTR